MTTFIYRLAHILAYSAESGGELWSIPVKGGAPEKSPPHLPVGHMAVSPDGTRIAFNAWESASR